MINLVEGFLCRMDKLESVVMTTAWNNILDNLNTLNISLQDPTVSLNTATHLMALSCVWLNLNQGPSGSAAGGLSTVCCHRELCVFHHIN